MTGAKVGDGPNLPDGPLAVPSATPPGPYSEHAVAALVAHRDARIRELEAEVLRLREVKLPDDPPPCPPQTFSRAPHTEWAMVGLGHNRCRWGPQAGSSDTEHAHHVCAHPRRQCTATP